MSSIGEALDVNVVAALQQFAKKRLPSDKIDLPVVVYNNKKHQMKHIRGGNFRDMMRKTVRETYQGISKEELLLYSCNSVT